MFNPHSLTSFLCLAATTVCGFVSASPRRFLQASLALAAISYVFATILAQNHVIEQNRLRQDFPVESIADRLSYETKQPVVAAKQSSTRTLAINTEWPPKHRLGSSQTAQDRLATLEEHVQWDAERNRYRSWMLKNLHEASVSDFINSPGFGVTRMTGPTRTNVAAPEAKLVGQPPAEYEPPDRSTPSKEIDVAATNDKVVMGKAPQSPLQELHENGFIDFVNARGFGYFKDRNHVAGFQTHQFREIPKYESKDKENPRWRIQRLELVSLLKFAQPAVYLSEHLPRMDELREAKTRALDEFEKRGLQSLRQGEDLEYEATADRIRMMGSIRCLQQCTDCHYVSRGDLLGAFSYVLKRVPDGEQPYADSATKK
jgi:hypothetical protein